MAKKTYAEKLLDPRWQQLRLRVFERDRWTCRCCGSKDKTLNAHHPVYHPLAEGPWDYDDESIITLCSECHSDEHASLDSAKANLLIAIVKMGYWGSYEMENLCDLLSSFTKDDLNNLFVEINYGKN